MKFSAALAVVVAFANPAHAMAHTYAPLLTSLQVSASAIAPDESVTAPRGPSFATVADLTIDAPLIVDATVTGIKAVRGSQAVTTPGHTTWRVTVKPRGFVKGAATLAKSVQFLAVTKGTIAPVQRKAPVLVFANPVAGRPKALQLIAADSVLPWTGQTHDRVTRLLGELAQDEAPAQILTVAQAFHSPSSVPGEGRTQLFLQTSGAPASITVAREQGGAVRVWGASFGELLQGTGVMPAPETLAWYRLACGLPDHLPRHAVAPETSVAHWRILAEDYALVRATLGPCARTA